MKMILILSLLTAIAISLGMFGTYVWLMASLLGS
jgi:hypothetical protein